MDISNPTIIRVNARNYRCLHPTNFKQRSKQSPVKQQLIVDEYDDEEIYVEDFPITEPVNLEDTKLIDRDDEDSFEQEDQSDEMKVNELLKNGEIRLEIQKDGKYMCAIRVPDSVRGYLIGRNGVTIKEICNKAKVEIDFPEQHRKDDPFLVFGLDERSVLSACMKINDMIEKKRKTSTITHFLAFRCDNDEVRSNYEKFKEIVISKHLPQGFPEEVFIGAAKLHLTILTFTLLDNFERNKVVSFMNKNLKKLINQTVNDTNLLKDKTNYQFKIKGLDYMNDDPSAVKILYGKVEDSGQFVQTLAEKVNAAAVELGYTTEYYSKVKLHMTLMNTRYVAKFKKFNSFDATSILNEFKDFHFGTVQLKDIHLLVSGRPNEQTGGYRSTHKIDVF